MSNNEKATDSASVGDAVAAEEDIASVWFLEEFCPELLILLEHAPHEKILAAILERLTRSTRYVAQVRYRELRESLMDIEEETTV